jgi:hypothetical protein
MHAPMPAYLRLILESNDCDDCKIGGGGGGGEVTTFAIEFEFVECS